MSYIYNALCLHIRGSSLKFNFFSELAHWKIQWGVSALENLFNT